MVNKGSHPQMALIQISEILQFTQIHILVGGLEHEFYFSRYWEFHNPN